MAGDVRYHVHFGPGKLGLGFVIPTVKELQLPTPIKTILAARRAGPSKFEQERNDALQSQHEYDLVIKRGDEHPPLLIGDIDLVYTNDETETLVNYIAHPSTILITTAVGGKGFPDIATLLAQGLMRRAGDTSASELIVIACENPPLSSNSLGDEVRRQLEGKAQTALNRVRFLNAIVDRVCPTDCRLESGRVMLDSVEEYRKWVVLNIGQQADSSAPHPILSSPIETVSSPTDFEYLEKRKTWLVNGAHVAIAFFARARGIDGLQAALEDGYVLRNITAIQRATSQALYLHGESSSVTIAEGTPENIRIFAAEVLNRIKSGPDDSTNRILADWLKWGGEVDKLNAFLRKSILRSIEPCEVLLQANVLGQDSEAASAFTELLVHKIRLLETVSHRRA